MQCWRIYLYICYSILKAKTYNWCPNTRTSNNYKQKATVTSLANGEPRHSCAEFWLLRVKKIFKWDNFADIGVIVGMPAGSEGMLQAFVLVWQTAQNGCLHKTGEPTIRAACTPQTVLDRHFWCLFCFFYQYLAIFLYCTSNKACLLCTTPASTHWMQSPEFPKIVYHHNQSTHSQTTQTWITTYCDTVNPLINSTIHELSHTNYCIWIWKAAVALKWLCHQLV